MIITSSITWKKDNFCSKCSKPTLFNSCSECSKTHYLQEKLHYLQLLERLNTLCKPLSSITPGKYSINNGLYQVLAVKRSIPNDLMCVNCQQVPMKQEKHQYYCPSCQYSFQNQNIVHELYPYGCIKQTITNSNTINSLFQQFTRPL